MNNWTKAVSVKTLTWAAVVNLAIMPCLLPFTSAAHAQPGFETAPTAAVLDFNNTSGYGGAGLARTAADAVGLEIRKSNRFALMQQSAVDRQLSDLGLVTPLNRIGYLRLGQALRTDTFITGDVRSVTFSGTPRQCRVILEVRFVDTASGETVNGSVKAGMSNPRPGYSGEDDTLLNEAIGNAAFEAVREVLTYTIPESTVLNTRAAREVILNSGLRSGIKEGMEMIIIRRGEEVARIRVRRVSDHDAEAIIIAETRGVRPEDKARAIFRIPEVSVDKASGRVIEHSTSRSRSKGLGAIGGVLLAVGVIYAVTKMASGNNEAAGKVVAEPGRDRNGLPIMQVTWSPSIFAKSDVNRIQWQIYRSDVQTTDGNGARVPVGVLQGNQTTFIDTLIPATFVYASLPHHEQAAEDPNYTDGTGVAITPGVNYTYEVALTYSQLQVTGGQSQTVFRTSRATGNASATVIAPPTIVTPLNRSQDVDPRDVQFTWTTSAGANEYVVEVSYDKTFINRAQTFVSPIISSTGGGGISLSTERLNIEGAPLNINRGQRVRLFWRVGARSAFDRPGPRPDPTGNGSRFVFSDPFEFDTQELPPPPNQ